MSENPSGIVPTKRKRAPRKGVEITPYKGGRTADFPRSRITAEDRRKLDAILEKLQVSAADWAIQHIEVDYKRILEQSEGGGPE